MIQPHTILQNITCMNVCFQIHAVVDILLMADAMLVTMIIVHYVPYVQMNMYFKMESVPLAQDIV